MNRLGDEASPYLRQHADNPVDWYPWGDDAFAEARRRNVPIFLSVGYSSCHWCHVMAHESFEDADVASYVNEAFVNVKVDREERPDVDALYMQATQAMTGRGGWPMSVWMTPDGRPFHAGTYFPPEDRHGMPSFRRVCGAVSEAWQTKRDDVEGLADRLTGSISAALPVPDGERADFAGQLAGILDLAVESLASTFDPVDGGFSRAPKFPHATTLSLLARAEQRRRAVGASDDTDPTRSPLTMLTTTLDAMACGGIHDHIGGGFARYSVDGRWMIPHFEKMLYDNALLLRAYTDGIDLTGSDRWQRVVDDTVTWMLDELRHPSGGFYSAYDADSDGVEGKYYAWDPEEVRAVCGTDADAALEYWGIATPGNFTDPHTGFSGSVPFVADRTSEVTDTIERARAALAVRRAERVAPGLDDKILCEWNALAVRGLAHAGEAADRPDWIAAAAETAQFLLDHLRRDDGRLLRSWQNGRARHLAVAADYAALLDALVTLVEIDGPRWVDDAVATATGLCALFADPEGPGFFTTGSDAERLVVRAKDQMDDATPAANSLAARALARLGHLTDTPEWVAIARGCIDAVAPYFARHPMGFADAIEAAEEFLGEGCEIVVVGAAHDPLTDALWRVACGARRPGVVTLRVDAGAEATGPLSGLLAGRVPHQGGARAYVCRGFVCAAPTSDPTVLQATLDELA